MRTVERVKTSVIRVRDGFEVAATDRPLCYMTERRLAEDWQDAQEDAPQCDCPTQASRTRWPGRHTSTSFAELLDT